jgi:hypothetical protein
MRLAQVQALEAETERVAKLTSRPNVLDHTMVKLP